jgi:hypothetical protein
MAFSDAPYPGAATHECLSCGGFYEWLTRPESNRSMTNRTILVRIRESFEASHQTYGSPRVWRDLRDWNIPCSENRTARLMRQAGLVARARATKLALTSSITSSASTIHIGGTRR